MIERNARFQPLRNLLQHIVAGDDADLELAQPGAIEELAALDGERPRVEPPGVGDNPQRSCW